MYIWIFVRYHDLKMFRHDGEPAESGASDLHASDRDLNLSLDLLF